MNKAITKDLMAILLRDGIEIWVEKSRIENIIANPQILEQKRFLDVDEETINTADITGIFKPSTMEDLRHRKNGEWKCSFGVWHKRGEKCNCYETEKYKNFNGKGI